MSAPVVSLIDLVPDYKSLPEILQLWNVPDIEELATVLIQRDILIEKGSRLDIRELQMEATWAWGHDARYFHFNSSRQEFVCNRDMSRENLVTKAALSPPPSPYLQLGLEMQKLPNDSDTVSPLCEILAKRRTHRQFAGSEISLSAFSMILKWTWGKIADYRDPELGDYIFKTSPSGGARHPVEVYPIVMQVESVRPGLYHFDVKENALEIIELGDFSQALAGWCSNQLWVANGAAAFLMTGRLDRIMWKYAQSHAYRVLMMDAGHLGQTFHLICAEQNLCPFTTAALNETQIAESFNLNTIEEIPLYMAVVGASQATILNSYFDLNT